LAVGEVLKVRDQTTLPSGRTFLWCLPIPDFRPIGAPAGAVRPTWIFQTCSKPRATPIVGYRYAKLPAGKETKERGRGSAISYATRATPTATAPGRWCFKTFGTSACPGAQIIESTALCGRSRPRVSARPSAARSGGQFRGGRRMVARARGQARTETNPSPRWSKNRRLVNGYQSNARRARHLSVTGGMTQPLNGDRHAHEEDVSPRARPQRRRARLHRQRVRRPGAVAVGVARVA
jgi:hypothetical protein